MKVVGIDPGSRNLGWATIDWDEKSSRPRSVDFGTLRVSAQLDFFQRISSLGDQLDEIVQKSSPQVAVVEKIFLGKSVDSAFKLGHIRGLCVASCYRVGARIVEYAPRSVKKQITGSGASDKMLVQKLLFHQLGIRDEKVGHDASDALALAFCYILNHSVERKNQHLRPI